MGTTVNNMVNLARDWSQKIHPETNKPQGLLKRLVAPRAAMTGAAVCDIGQVAKNMLQGTIQIPGVAAKWVIKPFSWISGSEAVKKFESRFPGLSDLLKTVARIVAFAIGAGVAGTVGIVYPRAGIKLHDAMGLSYDKRAAAILEETKKTPPCCEEKVAQAAPVEEILSTIEITPVTISETKTPVAIPVAQEEPVEHPPVASENTPQEPLTLSTSMVVIEEEKVITTTDAETPVETKDSVEIEDESTDYSFKSDEEEASSSEETPATEGLKGYAYTLVNKSLDTFNWLSSQRPFKFFTAGES